MTRPKHRPQKPRAHKVEALAEAWDCSSDAIRQALREGRIRGFRFGRAWRVTDEEKLRVERGETGQ